MPCVLQNATPKELDQWWANASNSLSPAPLFLRYKCGYVPIGIFTAMIASFTEGKEFKLITKRIKKNLVQFRHGSDYNTVTLISNPKYYAIHISRMSSSKIPTQEVCNHVRKLVESTLKKVTAHMNYSFHVEYQLAFECPFHPGREHLCVVDNEYISSPHIMCCLNDMKDPEPLEMQS